MQKKYSSLAHPPIKEAILQLLVLPSDTFNTGLIKQFVEADIEHYPENQSQRETLIQFMTGSDGEEARTDLEDKGVKGYKTYSKDGLNIVQAYKDRLAISRLEPYKSWDNLLEETKRVWELYKAIVKPKEIVGISVRYINHFMLPPNMEKFEDYLESMPNHPTDLPQALASFYVNYKLPNPDIGAVANIQLLFEGIRKAEDSSKIEVPIVLDNDLQKKLKIDVDESDIIWQHFSDLHQYKNDIFFSIVKEKSMELFK